MCHCIASENFFACSILAIFLVLVLPLSVESRSISTRKIYGIPHAKNGEILSKLFSENSKEISANRLGYTISSLALLPRFSKKHEFIYVIYGTYSEYFRCKYIIRNILQLRSQYSFFIFLFSSFFFTMEKMIFSRI